MKMSKNSKEHYHGIPNKDECMEFAGEISAIIMLILFIVFLIAMS